MLKQLIVMGVIGIATAKSMRITADEARRFLGQPVCIVLKDRSYVIGWLTEVEGGQVIVHGRKGRGKVKPSTIRSAEKARVAGLFAPFGQAAPAGGIGGIGGWGGLGGIGGPGGPGTNPLGGGLFGGGGGGGLLGSLFGGGNAGGAAAQAGGGGGFMNMLGMIGKAWPGIRMGFGMLRTIIPLLGGLKI